jgi:molybdenum cofactor guanylyltransferase
VTAVHRAEHTALILAGGKATRLGGVDKREIVIGGRTIFARQVEALAPCVAEIIVSSRRAIAGYRTVADAVDDAGPLAGIAAGLDATATPWLFVLAGDMPYIERAVIERVLGHAGERCDAVGIQIGGRPQPLCTALRVAVWRPIVGARLAARQLKVASLLTDAIHDHRDDRPRVHWIEEPELRAIDPLLRSLYNVNTPEDL